MENSRLSKSKVPEEDPARPLCTTADFGGAEPWRSPGRAGFLLQGQGTETQQLPVLTG